MLQKNMEIHLDSPTLPGELYDEQPGDDLEAEHFVLAEAEQHRVSSEETHDSLRDCPF